MFRLRWPGRLTGVMRLLSARSFLWCAVERAVAAIALVLTIPVSAAVGLTILVLSRRNPLIRHVRAGLGGKPLGVLKFRTMWDGSRGCGIFTLEEVSGIIPEVKHGADPRVRSRFAAFCRKHSLDEIPQLFHVMRGEMSLVGPRPMTYDELRRHYADCAHEILSVRPGMTGIWVVMGRSHLRYRERKKLDLWLVRRPGVGLYLRILARSIPVVLSGKGAY
ncbi:MAG TPA: sugar transferase [Bryobacteraceae bacterium]|nr:sugar transferase [Bryobacteraceae bacterium]